MDTEQEMIEALDQMREALRQRFPGAAARLEQLDSHLATVKMVIGHIFGEAVKEAK